MPRFWCLLIGCALVAQQAAAQPQDPCLDPNLTCGKAHAAIAHDLDAEADELGESLVREAMTDTDVLHYDIDIELSAPFVTSPQPQSCTVAGTCVMTIQNKSAALSEFTFRLRNQYTISSALVNGSTSVSVATMSTTTRRVTLDRTYLMDEIFTLSIAYNGTSTSAGFGSFAVATQGGTSVVASLSEAWYAYTWWPAKDGDTAQPGDNSDKATFEMAITVPNNWTVPSNGVLLGVDSLGGGRNRYRWATNYPMTTYLFSIAATNYNTWTQTYSHPGGTMPVQFYIYPGSDTPANRTAWEKTLLMLPVFRNTFGEYPFINEKYGLYQFPFGGGMEHQTITGQGTFSESVTAHELGHQWWGDMITCKTWSDIWLNEGFATYSECLWEERKTGSINTAAYFAALNARRPSTNGANDSVYIQPSVITSMSATNGMNRIFDADYSYDKGAWVLHMLRHIVGDAAFFDILTEYRDAYQYSAATTEDFANIAEGSSGVDLTPFFNQYVYNKGAPAYQYGWQSANVNGQNYLLTRIAQTQTATSGSPPQTLSVYNMPVDLSATIGTPQIVKVQNTARTQWFVVPVSGPVTALAFDVAPYILRGTTTSVAYIAGPPKVISTAPALGESLASGPGQLIIWFHTNVNAAASDFSVVGANSGPQSFTLVNGANVNPVVLDFGGPLPFGDTYTVTIQDSVIAANSSMPLDGEIADATSPASLPSGDGIAGGDAAFQFTVIPCNVVADIDADCDVDDLDVDLFTQVLIDIDTDPQHIARSDLDGSSAPDAADIPLFIAEYLNP